MVLLSVLGSVTSSYLTWSSGQAVSVLVVSGVSSLLVCLQWPVVGSLVCVSSATFLSVISQRAHSHGTLLYLSSDRVSSPTQEHYCFSLSLSLSVNLEMN